MIGHQLTVLVSVTHATEALPLGRSHCICQPKNHQLSEETELQECACLEHRRH